MATWDDVREIALSFPEVEEGGKTGPAYRLRGKLLAWESPKRDAHGALAVMVDHDEKQLILASNPDVYFTIPHYDGYPAVLVRLERIEREELRERLEDAWLLRAPKRLAAAFVESAETKQSP
jgi:hypothetical protein